MAGVAEPRAPRVARRSKMPSRRSHLVPPRPRGGRGIRGHQRPPRGVAFGSGGKAGINEGGDDKEGAAAYHWQTGIDWLSLQAVTMRESWFLSWSGRADVLLARTGELDGWATPPPTHAHAPTNDRAHSHDFRVGPMCAARPACCTPYDSEALPASWQTHLHAGLRFGHARGRFGRAECRQRQLHDTTPEQRDPSHESSSCTSASTGRAAAPAGQLQYGQHQQYPPLLQLRQPQAQEGSIGTSRAGSAAEQQQQQGSCSTSRKQAAAARRQLHGAGRQQEASAAAAEQQQQGSTRAAAIAAAAANCRAAAAAEQQCSSSRCDGASLSPLLSLSLSLSHSLPPSLSLSLSLWRGLSCGCSTGCSLPVYRFASA